MGSSHGAGGEFGVHVIRHIGSGAAGGKVGIVAQHDAGAARRDGVGVVALLGQAGQGNFIETDFGQRGRVAIGAAWVAIDDADQFANGVGAIANHQRRVAAGGGNQLVTDDQQAVVVAGQIFFDQDIVAVVDSNAIGVADLLLSGQVDRNTLALIAIARFDNNRQADFLCRSPGVVFIFHWTTQRHSNAGGVEQGFGQFLVLRNGFANGAGETGFSRLNALLLATPAKLDKAALRQAAIGDAAGHCCCHDGTGRGAEADIFIQLAQDLEHPVEIEGGVVECREAKLFGEIESQSANVLFGVFDHHLIDARFKRLGATTEGDWTAGLGLQAKRGEFQGVRHRNGIEMVGRNQVAQRREALA